MPRADPNAQLPGVDELLRAVSGNVRDLRTYYRGKPLLLARDMGLRLPRKPHQVMQELGLYDEEVDGPIEPGIRELVEDVCTLEVKSAVAVANRGGGKSMGVSFIEFYLVWVELFDALNLGGSELQADQVYQYLLGYIESSEYWRSQVQGDPMRERTNTIEGAWVRVLTASQKSVRSPHAGGRKKDGRMAGGLLVIDEEAEAAPEIVNAALPTVNTARPSVVVRCSTFHNLEGTFAELIDNHEEAGFKKYNWDIFDVCERCECKGDACESEEKCFREDHIEKYVDPVTGVAQDRLLHKAYCGGRAKYADGWVPMTEVVALWQRMLRNHAQWEVEAMGSRPPSSGFVIQDQQALQRSITKTTAESLYLPGAPVTVCVDWGTGNAGVSVWQHQPGNKHIALHAQQISEAGPTQILGVVVGFARRYINDLSEIAADAGGGGNYMNPMIRESYSLPVRDVFFAEEKEAAAAALNIFNEGNRVVIPAEHALFIAQCKKWKRKNGRIQKGNDHICDSSLCYFSKFVTELGLEHVKVKPRTFSTHSNLAPTTNVATATHQTVPVVRRRPMARVPRRTGRK